VTRREVRWLVPGLIPRGKLTIIDGDPGQGKSMLTLELAAALSRGMIITPDGRVPLDPEDTVAPRLDHLEADGKFVAICPCASDQKGRICPWAFPTHDALFANLVREMRPQLVVIDPVMAFLAAGVSPNSDQEVRLALLGLQRVAQESGAAIVLVRHLNKSGGQKVIYRGGGSIGLVGLCRSALYVGPNPDDPDTQILAHVKSNNGRLQMPWTFRLAEAGGRRFVEWTGKTDVPLGRLIGERPEKLPVEMAEAFLKEQLADNKPHEVDGVKAAADAKGIKKKTLENAKRNLGVRTEKIRGVWHWIGPNSTWSPNLIDSIQSDAGPEQ
jgi:hypothetical protein